MNRKRKAASIVLFSLLDEEETFRPWKRGKTREWIKRRAGKGHFNNIVRELRMEDTRGYKEMMRMNYEQFLEILTEIEPIIAKKQIQGGHKVISPAERLVLTIRFLATGESFTSLHFQFRIGKSTISYIVREVCQAIYKKLEEKYLSTPKDEVKWKEIANEFEKSWQFPNCIGAIDGKHLVMQPPTGSGSHYYNYKHTHSVVLMAIAGPDYECLYADVGTNGRISDGGVWNKCAFLKGMEDDKFNIPKPVCLPLGKQPVPFLLVGDEAFALKSFLMKPYPQKDITPDRRAFNYR